jgi:hypothetical protein
LTAPVLAVSTPNGRFYEHPRSKSRVPSITNIIGKLDKPALKWWAAKQAATFAAQNIDVISQLKTEAERIDLIKGAPFRSTAGSSDVGNQVHDWIDGYAKNYLATGGARDWVPEDLEQASITARRMWNQFTYIDGHYSIDWLVSEFTVWSDENQYAGTGDWIARIGGAVVYGDTKTGNGVYPEVGLQVAAGANADYALDGDGNQYQLPEPEKYAVLHVRPTFTRMSPLNGIPGCFTAFLALRSVFEWQATESEQVLSYAPQIKGPR